MMVNDMNHRGDQLCIWNIQRERLHFHPFCQFDFKSIRIKSNDRVFWFNKGFVIENNYLPLLQLTVMIFVFLGLVAGFGGLLAIVFHFFSSLGFPLVLDFFSSSWGKRALGKWSSGCGELGGARRQNSCSCRRGLVLIRRSPPLLTPPRIPGT